MSLNTNFNVAPYYDDYDQNKKFYRILFKPGFAVQARELTQLQTILQKQVDRFGKHVFKDGSLVTGGQFSIDLAVDYVKIQDLDSLGDGFDINDFLNVTFTGATTGVKAYVVLVADGSETSSNVKTLYVRYLNSGTNGTTKVFNDGEVIQSSAGNLVVLSSSATGTGSLFTIEEGVIYSKEHFVYYPRQTVVLSRYTNSPSARVGFLVSESIVKYSDDESLLDPALGSSNYFAQGADRFKIDPVVNVYDYNANITTPDYIELFTIQNGILIETYERPTYNVLRKELAKRTFDESGDYYVNGLTVRVREHLDNSENGGLRTANSGGNVNLLAVGVEPGTAYVKGFEVYANVTRYVNIEKAITYENVNSQIATSRIGNYVVVNEATGFINQDSIVTVGLYDAAQTRLTSNVFANVSQTGNLIGNARVKGFEYDSGTLGTPQGNIKLYLFDIKMLGGNAFANARSVYYNNPSSTDFGADIVLTGGSATLNETLTNNPLLYYVGSDFVRTIRDNTDSPDLTFTFKKSSDVSIATAGTFTFTTSGTETFPYGSTGTLSATEKSQLALTINGDVDINLSATVTRGGTNTLVSNTNTFSRMNVGDKLSIVGQANVFRITSITSGTNANVAQTVPTSVNGNLLSKAYRTGDIIDLRTIGFTGNVARTVTINSDTSLTVNLQETFPSSASGTINYRAVRGSAREIAKTLRPNRLVVIDTLTTGNTGPINLGISDLYQIRQIRQNATYFGTVTDGSNVTSNFTIDNGQRDDFYDHATITPKTALPANVKLLVELDYFQPDFSQGVGYFSVDSYPINDNVISNSSIQTSEIPIYRSPTNGLTYDLRNHLDFRPVKTNTATDTTTLATANSSPNPSSTDSFQSGSGGIRLVAPLEQIIYDYSYYIPRIDLIVVDKDANFYSVTGVPSLEPTTPLVPENAMALAKIYVTAYPSIAPNYAQFLNRRDLQVNPVRTSQIRYTMEDIGLLKNRIDNLEQRASLNSLEKAAIDFNILDDSGVNRLKNGIFVDSFVDHSLGATYDPDYKITVDPIEKAIRPAYEMDSIYYDYVSGSGVVKKGDLITLPYTETVLIEQPRVTTTRNIETSVYRFIGNMYLNPSTDVWVDTTYAPDNQVTVESNPIGGPLTTEWNAWQTRIVGYNLYNSETGQLLATFQDKEAALANARALNRNVTLSQNTFGYTGGRTGTIVEEVSERFRTGAEQYYAQTVETQKLGNKLINIDIVPYIRPQTIQVNVKGLKATTRLYTFFDGENMSSFVTPTNSSYTPTGSEGSNLLTNSSGEVYFLLRLPSTGKQFRVGTKEVKITDSPTNESDATTQAVSYFVAQGLIQQKQNDIITTRAVITLEKEVTEAERVNSNIQTLQRNQLGGSCMAYSFLPKAPDGEEGIYLTSVDVFVAGKHPTLGIWFEIREMDSGGGITRNQVPFSEVWVNSADVPTSTDASVPLNIEFPSPVFLYNDTQYAFVIHTEGINPDYYFYVARLGQTDTITQTKYTSRPLTGTLYTTNNNLNWDIVPEVDMKVKFYRANFTTGSGTVVLGNKPTEFLKLGNVTGSFNKFGELFIGNDVLTVTTPSGGTIVVGDQFIGATSAKSANVLSINGSVYTMSNVGFVVGETISVSNTLGSRGITTTVSASSRATGALKLYKTSNTETTVQLTGTSNTFFIGDTIRGQLSGDTATVDEVRSYNYYLLDFEPDFLRFNKTPIKFAVKTTSLSSNTLSSSFEPINESDNFVFANEQVLMSRTTEVSSLSGSRSNQIQATLSSTSSYLSPVLDIGRTHSIYVRNDINNSTAGETGSGGSSLNRYISKTVTLAEGQDAEDMIVICTAYRPPNTDFRVYARLLNKTDIDLFNNKSWIEMEKVDDNVFSSLANAQDYKEFQFKFSDSRLSGPNKEVQYTGTDGSLYTGYKHFAIKIVLTSSNGAVVPKVGDLRVIALQK
jgi:hypothetical protein